MNRKIWLFVALFAGAITAAFLAGRAWRVAPEATVEQADVSTPPIQDTVRLDDTAQRRMGLRTVRAEMRTIGQTVQATGHVGPDETRIVHIRAMARGRIESVHVRLGDRVKAGQQLLTYDNVELGEAIGQYLSALADLEKVKSEAEVARRSLERAGNLVNLGAVAKAEYDRREAEHRNALATVESQKAETAKIEEKLHRFGMTDPEIEKLAPGMDYHRAASHTTLTAPFAGIITKYSAAQGEPVGPDDPLVSVADLSTVWVQADIYERDIAAVRQGTTATVTVDPYPGRTFSGRITYISDFLDPNTRTAKVRCEVPNHDGVLKLDMFATVFIPVPEGKPAVVIPVEAVQQIDEQPVAFVPAGNGQFRQRGLKLGRRAGEWVEVMEGIRPGEQVVTEGSFVLKSEAKKAELGHHEE